MTPSQALYEEADNRRITLLQSIGADRQAAQAELRTVKQDLLDAQAARRKVSPDDAPAVKRADDEIARLSERIPAIERAITALEQRAEEVRIGQLPELKAMIFRADATAKAERDAVERSADTAFLKTIGAQQLDAFKALVASVGGAQARITLLTAFNLTT